MNRLIPTLSCVAALGLSALGLSGCSSALGYAAKVNGTVITRTQLDQQLADISRNKKVVAELDQPGSTGGPVEGATKGSYNKAFVARLLNAQIQSEIIHQRLAARKALPTPDQLVTAKGNVVGQFSQNFNAFPSRYQNLLISQRAEFDAFAQSSDADIAAYYQAHLSDYQTEFCVRHILLAEPGTGNKVDYPASLATAKQVSAQLAAGADFATVAKAQSKDTGSASQGGTLAGSAPDACITRQDLQRVVAPFARAVLTLPVNKVSDPVQTTFGYHLIEVTSTVVHPFDAAVKADILQKSGSARLDELVKVANVKINPEFGTFDRTVTATGITGVVPPRVSDAVTTTSSSLPAG